MASRNFASLLVDSSSQIPWREMIPRDSDLSSDAVGFEDVEVVASSSSSLLDLSLVCVVYVAFFLC